MTPPAARIGVIADDTLQGHLLSTAIRGQGYQVVISTDPENLAAHWLDDSDLDLWVVDLSREDRWQHFLDRLLEGARAPLLFCDGQAPPRNAAHYPRWERRLLSKLLDYVGPPALQERLQSLPPDTRAPIPEPREFRDLPRQDQGRPRRVWVLGASLGGPAAVKRFLDSLPEHLPVAFVLAQHIDPGFLGTLRQVLDRNPSIRCRIGDDGSRLCHGEVLLAPVDQAIRFHSDGRVVATGNRWEGPYAPSIDQLMTHVLEGIGHCAGAILFSGMGNDGAIAAPRLAASGTMVWAQSTDTCAASSQPDSVRETGCVSYSGSPEQLADQLVEQVRRELSAPGR